MTPLARSEGPDQIVRMRRLIWAFAVRIFPKTRFRMGDPYDLFCTSKYQFHNSLLCICVHQAKGLRSYMEENLNNLG